MKVEQEGKKFQPVTITLESEQEVKLLAAALARVTSTVQSEANQIYSLYVDLQEVSDYRKDYTVVLVGAGIRIGPASS